MKALRKITSVHMMFVYLMLVFGFGTFGMPGLAIASLVFFPFIWIIGAVIVTPKPNYREGY